MGKSNRIMRDVEQEFIEAVKKSLEKVDSPLPDARVTHLEFVEGVTGIAELLNVSEATVKRWVRKGKLPVWQPHGKRGKLYLSRDVVAHLLKS